MGRHWKLMALVCIMAASLARADDGSRVVFYDRDPAHPWNQLYGALMVRTPGANVAAGELLDPPYWSGTKHLLEGDSNRRAIENLRDFAAARPLPVTSHALSRAAMQRDLIGVFHWLCKSGKWTGPKRELAAALSKAIHHIAMTETEIRGLPDNYSAAVATTDKPTTYDSTHPVPFLPKDLLSDDGPWLSLASKGDDGLPATFHVETFYTRSVFEIRMRHPEGRAAGEAYLKELATFPNPFVTARPSDPSGVQRRGQWTNPETPQFPPGTMWALVRRAILCDADGNPVPSPLIESVQIRVYNNLGYFTEPEVCRVLNVEPAQLYFGWEMQRDFLNGNSGLRLTTPEDQFYADFPPRKSDPYQTERTKQSALNCYQCHTGKGIHSVASRMRPFDSVQRDDPLVRPTDYVVANRDRLDSNTIYFANRFPAWELLRWLATADAP